VSKIGEECPKQEVLTTMRECLIVVFGAKGDMLNAWIEDEKVVSILIPVALSKVARGRKDIGKKLKDENKEMRTGHWLPKVLESARTTGLTFDTTDHAEAKKLVDQYQH